jgi:hypothetical protein
MAEIRLYKSIWQGVKLLLISTVFVLLSIHLFNTEKVFRWVAWIPIVPFGGFCLFALYIIFDRRSHIIINEEGIYDRYYCRRIIPWSIIHSANLCGGGKKICLFMEASYPARGKVFKAIHVFEKEGGFQDLILSVQLVHVDKQKLLALINTLIKANPRNRRDIIENGSRPLSAQE